MLQPRTYPELVGKALVLEAEPFAVMSDDDNPWVEGLFFVVCIGLLVGVAQIAGGILLTAAMPPVESLREAGMMVFRQFAPVALGPFADLTAAEEGMRRAWDWLAFWSGYGGGWTRLLMLVYAPAGLVALWLAYGVTSFVAARWLGGTGSLNRTLGVIALTASPQVLLVVTVIPFANAGLPLLLVWTLLIGFRGIEVAHDLTWEKSVLAALAGPAVLLLLAAGALMVWGLAVLLGGGL